MTTLGQVKTYVQNHLVAVVATSVVALVAIPTIATTIIYQTIKDEHQTGPWSIFNLKSYEVIKKVLGSKEGKINDEESEDNGDGDNNNGGENEIEVKIKGDENQMQQPPVDEAKDQH